MYQPEKLKARRKELKLTQKEIAEQLGISFQAYSAWERGVKEPSEEKVSQLEKKEVQVGRFVYRYSTKSQAISLSVDEESRYSLIEIYLSFFL